MSRRDCFEGFCWKQSKRSGNAALTGGSRRAEKWTRCVAGIALSAFSAASLLSATLCHHERWMEASKRATSSM